MPEGVTEEQFMKSLAEVAEKHKENLEKIMLYLVEYLDSFKQLKMRFLINLQM